MTVMEPTPRQRSLLSLVRDRGTITRGEISELTGLSASQISRITGSLLQQGLLTVEERIIQGEGRPIEVLALSSKRHFVIGLDVGGLGQDVIIADLRGEIVCANSGSESLSGDRSEIVDYLREFVDSTLRRANIDETSVLGLGVGFRAVVDPVTGTISAGLETPQHTPSWSNFSVRAELARLFPWKRIVIDDTVRALAAAERRLGNAQGVGDFVFVLADSGIGAAFMINGRPYIGARHLAGEIGHVTIDPEGPTCGCGRSGCVEAFASTSAMLRAGRAEMGNPHLTIVQLIEAAARGNDCCRTILFDGGTALGKAIAILLNLLSPSIVVIGGEATKSDAYVRAAKAQAIAETIPQLRDSARIVTSAHRPYFGAAGAASMVLDGIFEPDPI